MKWISAGIVGVALFFNWGAALLFAHSLGYIPIIITWALLPLCVWGTYTVYKIEKDMEKYFK